MTTLQEAARDALEALERIGKDFVCRSAHHAKKDQHSAFAECPVVVRHTDAIESLRTALAQQVTLVPQEWTNLLAYALQDDMHNRLTPRVVDIAYTAFTLAKRPNAEDGGASDWFNDTKPKVTELIAKLRKDLIEEFAAAPAPVAQQGEQQVCAGCGIPVGDVHMSTCKSGKWPSRVSNGDTAAPAPVAQQGEQAKPAAYITDTWQGPMVWTPEMYNDACTYCDDGEFPVPLYTAAPKVKGDGS